jgi:hypothetical protein
LLGVSFITNLKPNLFTALNIQTTTENNCIISYAQNTTALQPNVFLTGTLRLLDTKNGRSTFFRDTHCQGQLQTPQSVSSTYTNTIRIKSHIIHTCQFRHIDDMCVCVCVITATMHKTIIKSTVSICTSAYTWPTCYHHLQGRKFTEDADRIYLKKYRFITTNLNEFTYSTVAQLVRFPMMSLQFFIDIIVSVAL